MATRFYLPSSGAAAVSPAFDATWTDTADANRIRCVTSPSATAQADKLIAAVATSSTQEVLFRQFVSDPLTAQEILDTGFGSGQILATRDGFAENLLQTRVIARVVSGDGSTFRGTLFNALGTAGFDTTAENRFAPPTAAVDAVTVEDGDRIVLEIGVAVGIESPDDPVDLTLRFGDASGSDLPSNQTSTDDYNPWVSLTQTLTFEGGDELALEASVVAVSSVSASVSRERPLSASIQSASTVSAVISRERPLSASVAAQSTVSAAMARERPLTAQVAAQSVVAAVISRGKAITGASVAAQSSVSAAISRERPLSASVASASTVSATLSRERPLRASVESRSRVAVTLLSPYTPPQPSTASIGAGNTLILPSSRGARQISIIRRPPVDLTL